MNYEIKSVECEIFKKEITIFLGTFDSMVSWAKKEITNPAYKDFLDGLEVFEAGDADTHYDNSICIVRLPKYPETTYELECMNHELLHATMFILDSCGVRYAAWSNNETFTYLLEWLTKKTLEKDGYEKVSEGNEPADTSESESKLVTSS